jgi:hypothetical protein
MNPCAIQTNLENYLLAGIEMVRWADQHNVIIVDSKKDEDLYHFLVEKKSALMISLSERENSHVGLGLK